ncbi:hypothetical protein [Actinomadura craniellae]|uniref:hypothetical protein n=1 Tax=Actinomadura craniellae TaxID=2231787 RepID=UPI0011BFC714|nr:hypothetical protein [Actinomadura craniellae]
MAGTESAESDLTTALNHAWAWYEMSMNHRFQMANFYLLIVAGNFAAYIAAIQAKLHLVAGFVALMAALSVVIYIILARRARERLATASVPLKEIQSRLATSLGIDGLRMIEKVSSAPRWRRTSWIGSGMCGVVATVFLTAAAYAFAHS